MEPSLNFLHGLVFFSLGLILIVGGRRGVKTFIFARALPSLSLFAMLNALEIWSELFQTMAAVHYVGVEIAQVLVLATAVLALTAFALYLLNPEHMHWRRLATPLLMLLVVWLAAIVLAQRMLHPTPFALTQIADVLARYCLMIPATLLTGWALMRQQREFRNRGLSAFSHYLVWATWAIIVYGTILQLFGKQTLLIPSDRWHATQFAAWFGFPVQIAQTAFALLFTYALAQVISAFDAEYERRLINAHQERIRAQQRQLEAERLSRLQTKALNKQLISKTRELGLLLDLANILVSPTDLGERLHWALTEILDSVKLITKAMILLPEDSQQALRVAAESVYTLQDKELYARTIAMATEAVQQGKAMCLRLDGKVMIYHPRDMASRTACRNYPSPLLILCLPLLVQDEAKGCLTFTWDKTEAHEPLETETFDLIVAVTQQLGLSIEHARLIIQAQERERMLQNMVHKIVSAQEEERKRVARDLHDATAQSLTALSLGLKGLQRTIEKRLPEAAEQTRALGLLSTQALDELRQLIADLRPSQLDDLGLVPALRWYAQKYERWHGIPVTFEVEGKAIRMPSEYEIVLFRITQEALTNVSKHAHAGQVWIRLVFGRDHIELSIKDDGQGFDPSSITRSPTTLSGWGLLGMQERAALVKGTIDFISAPGSGTTVQVSIPRPQEVLHAPV